MTNVPSADSAHIQAPEGQGCPKCGGYVYHADQVFDNSIYIDLQFSIYINVYILMISVKMHYNFKCFSTIGLVKRTSVSQRMLQMPNLPSKFGFKDGL